MGPHALVAELVDALVSGTSGESRGGSSPLQGTKNVVLFQVKLSGCACYGCSQAPAISYLDKIACLLRQLRGRARKNQYGGTRCRDWIIRTLFAAFFADEVRANGQVERTD
jgi:hypothetical protein